MDIDISDKEFSLFQRLIYNESGINLTPAKKELLKSRLMKRLRERSLSSFKEYYKYVTEEDTTGEELVSMLDCISTNLTEFFREAAHFDFLSKKVLPVLLENKRKKREKRIRIWCAGCSTGEEPYSISMVLAECIEQLSEWDIKVLATDLSTRVLKKAMQGIYAKDRLQGIPLQMLNTYFEKGTHNFKDHYQIKESLRNLISFRRLNLTDETFPFKGQFDFIFCRNVMIYFNKQTQSKLVSKFYQYLTPDGYLFIGHSESLAGTETRFQYVRPTIYQK
ncbi:MAG: methyltransferase domain-containing protein [Candidatus Brocadia sp. AMX2]|uniref:protein-glutamate O-methyltransferase n=1 Tax=Candidatus Brocadia sinica JPN1 TaxID=1197129 RepID=A0ABQ0K1T4_9BACT|nr:MULTISPECIES: protein-glutamate O-methyltransferase [Brocadia]KXK26131.1 MAG: chemotaxis protein methyltransferase [Candidatus Brocadia sinica]MBC6933295.1 methyltransferase domain-containing protein [Candidatus Brocadia sp.]MBL1170172.1 methyltransferase domain-containing protein [Candidatus Brocadia sp. AMX1]NOG42538.1 protein-glutamate O-methyltransferase [Planctomycetota bacterium]KAA0242184.1 MAG: methyltransferase domain-containing protein [Candidatus Brocadia sp. AMX2]